METVKKMEIEVAAEALPKNERSEAILEQRRAAEEAKQLKLEQVSSISASELPRRGCWGPRFFESDHFFLTSVGTGAKGKGRKGKETARTRCPEDDERERETSSSSGSQAC
jgi:hypothetical protein